jgi:hypothetical protein
VRHPPRRSRRMPRKRTRETGLNCRLPAVNYKVVGKQRLVYIYMGAVVKLLVPEVGSW